MIKKLKAFTLIEVIIALFLISVLALYLLPSLYSVYSDSNKIKSDSRLIFAMQEVIELSKDKDEGYYLENCNGFDINVEVSFYSDKLKYIKVYKDKYILELVAEKWKKEDLLY